VTRRVASLASFVAIACSFGSPGATGSGGGLDTTAASTEGGDAPDDGATHPAAATSIATGGGGSADATSGGATPEPGTGTGSTRTSGDSGTAGASDTTSGGCVPATWYPDADGDGFGDSARGVIACDPPSADHVPDRGDCDEGDPNVNPGADETCNAIDDDCDGGLDEGSPANASCGGCTFVAAANAGSWFALCPGPLAWADARDACAAFGPGVDLARIDADPDQATLLALVTGDAWIGISDLDEENHWVWVDGSDAIVGGVVVGFDGWAVDQPDQPGVEHCAELDSPLGGWNDVTCDQLQPFLCRHPA
jgi:hypothetical protein